jgi:oligopeptide transport system ATP-binding protein
MTTTSGDDRSNLLVEVRGLCKHYPLPRSAGDILARRQAAIQAVSDVDLQIATGETVGLIGESGSGKSTLARVMLRLVPPTAGSVRFDGTDLLALRPAQLRRIRARMGVVLQNPYGAVNRRRPVRAIVAEPLLAHRVGTKRERASRVQAALEMAGLPSGFADRFPAELSGGQLQRVGIARALVLSPQFVVADEPTASLDVSIRAQIINLFADLKAQLGLAMLFISHDLGTVSYLADRVAVMYLGRIVESASAAALERSPLHPYTQALIASIPRPDPDQRSAVPPRGQIPSPLSPPPGCPYHPRCPLAMSVCRLRRPPLEEKASGHLAACHAVPAARAVS